jgi:AcrR family transcriptional regulator
MVCEVDAHGYEHTSVAAVAARAGLPEASFETHFASLEACFLETFDSLVGQVYAHVLSSYRSRGTDWRASVRSAMSTLARAVSMHPAAARMCLLQARTVSPRAASRCDSALALLEDAIAQMLADAPGHPKPPPEIATAIAGGIWHVLEARLRDDLTEEPSELAGRLLDVIVANLRPLR